MIDLLLPRFPSKRILFSKMSDCLYTEDDTYNVVVAWKENGSDKLRLLQNDTRLTGISCSKSFIELNVAASEKVLTDRNICARIYNIGTII